VKSNMFEMGAKIDDGWSSDNKNVPLKESSKQTKKPHEHLLHISKEKRRGKTVTIVSNFYLSKSDLQALLKSLKKSLGAGGTIRDSSLKIQGDLGNMIRGKLEEIGYRFKGN